uniref:WH1 domain-containing protein n=1 Tax=Periophthalmus magnuspinnatus TaxID=409849 RepID=A0A3B4BM45_9GOBI
MSIGQPPQRRPANVGSMLLTPQENECLFNHLGRKCMSLSSAVVQVFTAERNSSWSKRCCGVACLVKDNPLRSYFIRVFDLRDGKMMFEQELYNNFNLSSSRPYFITFTGDTCQVGLNFANEEEAKQFRRNVSDLVGRKQRKTVNGPSFFTCWRHFYSTHYSTRHKNAKNVSIVQTQTYHAAYGQGFIVLS